MKQVVIGTAGHIDHGKTALVRALTGIDCDRLKEEKERGITIELGFAYLNLPKGGRIGIVDVPGHERFVKQMVAGAAGIDIVVLIIAADEGVMPQTREHLDICTLLGVKRGLVALTKIDLVDQELRRLAIEEIEEFIKGTFLQGAPIIPCSAVTGEGIDELIGALERLVDEVQAKSPEGLFRLPIDRVFTMKGFGTVVTGTIVSGKVKVGDLVQVMPHGVATKVRGLQVHSEQLEEAVAGQRTAINLQGVQKEAICRGDVVLHPDTVAPTQLLDAEVIYLSHAPRSLRNGVVLRFHTGTTCQMAEIILLGTKELRPGERGYAQIRLRAPIVALPHDRFVLRGSSMIQTIGGGIILDAHPQRHKRFKGDVLNVLERLKHGDTYFMAGMQIKKVGVRGMAVKSLAGYTNLPPTILLEALDKLVARGEIVRFDTEGGRVIDGTVFKGLADTITDALKTYHEVNPLRQGMPREELKSKLPSDVDGRLFNALLDYLSEKGVAVQQRDKVWLSGHKVALADDQRRLEEEIETIMRESHLAPPSVKELGERLRASEREVLEILSLLVADGRIVKLKEGIYFHRAPIEELKSNLVSFLQEKGKITTQQFKALTGSPRKYTIPLAEYFDAIKLTVRVGDERILRGDRKG